MPTARKKIVLMLSGGLRSTALFYDLSTQGMDVHPVIFHERERSLPSTTYAYEHCYRQGITLHHIVLPEFTVTLHSGPVTYRGPMAVMYMIAAQYAAALGIRTVMSAVGNNAAQASGTALLDFLAAVNRLCTESQLETRVFFPYLYTTTAELIRRAPELGFDATATWACTSAGPNACGTCSGCQQFQESQREATLHETTLHRGFSS